jgi:hypothetical protein
LVPCARDGIPAFGSENPCLPEPTPRFQVRMFCATTRRQP